MSTPRELKPTPKDVAWAAGLYEGEGSCYVNKGAMQVQLAMKDSGPVFRLRLLFGGGVTVHQRRDRDYPMYHWQAYGARARGFAMTIYSFLSERRQKRILEGLRLHQCEEPAA